jgi:hypothetical protein
MKKAVLIFAITAMTAVSTAQAEVNVSVSIGVPPPQRVVVASSPSIYFDVAPLFVAPSRLGFYVGVDTPYDIIFSSGFYYLYYGNSWHRSGYHNGPWVEVPYREMPPAIRRYRIEQIRSYRDQEYRSYRRDRDHYRGQSFRPERKEQVKDERRHDKEQIKDERRRDKEEWKDERRRDKEERKDEKQHGHGRD